MKKLKIENQVAFTFDDLLLVPQHSHVLPNQVQTKTQLTTTITLNIPIMSAAMDTVTEAKLAIAMALVGGVGVIHKNMSEAEQVKMVHTVKHYRFDDVNYPLACVDHKCQLRVGAAIGIQDEQMSQVQALLKAEVDFLVLDSAHADSALIVAQTQKIKQMFPTCQLVVGNIVTASAAQTLIAAGANALKVGIGSGSICTTRIVAGVGVPQASALLAVCAVAAEKHIPVISDGGIKYSGDLTKALGLGANVVMLGSMLAGTDEAPGEIVEIDGEKFKQFMGMGSLTAMVKGSCERYFQKPSAKLVPEGIEGLKRHQGSVTDVLNQIVGGLAAGMGYVGASTISELQAKAVFVSITTASKQESHPHSLSHIKKTTNYH